MMSHWTAGHVLACLLWTLAVVLCVADLLVESNDIGHVGIVAAAGAGTLHVRCWLELGRTREREWYELGKMTEQGRPRSV